MRTSNRHHSSHDSHIWVPFVDMLFVVVAALILLGIDAKSKDKESRLYRSLEQVDLAQASSEGGAVPEAKGLIRLEPSGDVIVDGKKIQMLELRRYLGSSSPNTHYLLAVAQEAHAGDGERVELILRDSKLRYTRLFKKLSNPEEK